MNYHILIMKIEGGKNINYILMAFLATLFTYSVNTLGSSLVFFIKTINNKVLSFLLSFSSGVMIAAAFFSLLNPAIDLLVKLQKPVFISTTIGFTFGSLLIILSDILMEHKLKISSENKKQILLVTSITLHNIPEGLAVGVAFGCLALYPNELTITGAILIALGIGIQNFPEGASTSLALRAKGKSKFKSFIIGQASGIVEIIAGIIGAIFVSIIENMLPFLLSFSAGAMIAVCSSELIPDSFKENKILASLGLTIGFVIMMFLDITLS